MTNDGQRLSRWQVALVRRVGDAWMSVFIQRLATRSWQSMPFTTMYLEDLPLLRNMHLRNQFSTPRTSPTMREVLSPKIKLPHPDLG